MKRLIYILVLIALVAFATGACAMDETPEAMPEEGQEYLVTDDVAIGETDAGDVVMVEEENVTPIPPDVEPE